MINSLSSSKATDKPLLGQKQHFHAKFYTTKWHTRALWFGWFRARSGPKRLKLAGDDSRAIKVIFGNRHERSVEAFWKWPRPRVHIRPPLPVHRNRLRNLTQKSTNLSPTVLSSRSPNIQIGLRSKQHGKRSLTKIATRPPIASHTRSWPSAATGEEPVAIPMEAGAAAITAILGVLSPRSSAFC